MGVVCLCVSGACIITTAEVVVYSPVPVQFDWDKIRTEMKPIKMAKTKALDAQKKVPRKKLN